MDRKYGRGNELTYHEYVAAVMYGRVVVSDSRLTLICSYLDPGNVLYDYLNT